VPEMEIVIRAIPDRVQGWQAPGEQWFSTKGLTWDKKNDLVAELKQRGYIVQEVWPQDPMIVLVEARVRKELEQEAEEAEHRKAQKQ
jgi:hypothetical protein